MTGFHCTKLILLLLQFKTILKRPSKSGKLAFSLREARGASLRDLPPKIWSENNRKISTTIDSPPPWQKFLEESQVRGTSTYNYLNYLIASDWQVYRKIELIAITLMTSSRIQSISCPVLHFFTYIARSLHRISCHWKYTHCCWLLLLTNAFFYLYCM